VDHLQGATGGKYGTQEDSSRKFLTHTAEYGAPDSTSIIHTIRFINAQMLKHLMALHIPPQAFNGIGKQATQGCSTTRSWKVSIWDGPPENL
jgi:hypothetical protein